MKKKIGESNCHELPRARIHCLDHTSVYEIHLPSSTLLLGTQGQLFEHRGLRVRGSHRQDGVNVKRGLCFSDMQADEPRKGTLLRPSDKGDTTRGVQKSSKEFRLPVNEMVKSPR